MRQRFAVGATMFMAEDHVIVVFPEAVLNIRRYMQVLRTCAVQSRWGVYVNKDTRKPERVVLELEWETNKGGTLNAQVPFDMGDHNRAAIKKITDTEEIVLVNKESVRQDNGVLTVTDGVVAQVRGETTPLYEYGVLKRSGHEDQDKQS